MLIYAIILVVLLIAHIVLLRFLSSGFKRLNYSRDTAYLPFVSVIVCAHNEEKNLPDCLQLLGKQDYPEDKIEFIIVNDRSSDGTQDIIDARVQEDNRFITFKISDRRADFAPKKRAIDMAISKSRGDLILLTDADGRPGPAWVRTMVSYYSPETDMVIGYAPYKVKPSGHFIKKILSLEYLSHALIAAASTGIGYPLTCVGTNMSYRKSLYKAIDGFGPYKNYISGDDDLFLNRVRAFRKYTIRYATDVRTHVFNNPPQLWSKFLHQRMRYASKSFKYPPLVMIGLASFFLLNVLIFAGLVSFNQCLFFISLVAWLIKTVAEYFFFKRGARVLNDTRYLNYFPIAVVLHMPYVILFAILGQLKIYHWQGSNARNESVSQTRDEAI